MIGVLARLSARTTTPSVSASNYLATATTKTTVYRQFVTSSAIREDRIKPTRDEEQLPLPNLSEATQRLFKAARASKTLDSIAPAFQVIQNHVKNGDIDIESFTGEDNYAKTAASLTEDGATPEFIESIGQFINNEGGTSGVSGFANEWNDTILAHNKTLRGKFIIARPLCNKYADSIEARIAFVSAVMAPPGFTIQWDLEVDHNLLSGWVAECNYQSLAERGSEEMSKLYSKMDWHKSLEGSAI